MCKKIIFIILLMFLFVTACKKNTSSPKPMSSDYPSPTTTITGNITSEIPKATVNISSPTSTPSINTQAFTFQVNSNMPFYECITSTDDFQTTQIIIIDTDTDALIQTIITPDNQMFTKSAVYFVDVTFNGNFSIVLPIERPARYNRFNAYIWEDETKQFVETPSFQDILNPSIDYENKQILSRVHYTTESADYCMVKFKNGKFVKTNSFSWYPANNYEDSMQNKEQFMRCIEKMASDDGNQIVVKDFYVSMNSYGDIDLNDEQLRSYFETNSFWDLSSQKWKNYMLIDELKY